ncbi:MAG TPA: YfiR family protein [Candidatus Acidoferrum sp.]
MSRASHSVLLPARIAGCGGKATALRVVLVVTVVCLLACATLPVWSIPESAASEYRSKANFLATFPSFVEWPESAFSSAQSPFTICVRGDFSFGTSLAELTRGASPHGRRVEVRWVHKDQELRDCHIAFVSRSEAKRYAKLLQALEGATVLTVGETEGFLGAGGSISFSFEHDTLQFEVNLVASDTAHLRISSRLLALARHVVNRTEAAKS